MVRIATALVAAGAVLPPPRRAPPARSGADTFRHAVREHLLRLRALQLRPDRPALRDPQRGQAAAGRGRRRAATRCGAPATRCAGPGRRTSSASATRSTTRRRRSSRYGTTRRVRSLPLRRAARRAALHERARPRLLPQPRALVRLRRTAGRRAARSGRRRGTSSAGHDAEAPRSSAGSRVGSKPPPPKPCSCTAGDPTDKRVEPAGDRPPDRPSPAPATRVRSSSRPAAWRARLRADGGPTAGSSASSERNGLTCRNRAGHGFFLSRERWRSSASRPSRTRRRRGRGPTAAPSSPPASAAGPRAGSRSPPAPSRPSFRRASAPCGGGSCPR